MRIVLEDGDVGTETHIQEGDRISFDLTSKNIFFRRRGQLHGHPWTELAFSNANKTYPYQGDPQSLAKLIAETHCFGIKKVDRLNSKVVTFEFF